MRASRRVHETAVRITSRWQFTIFLSAAQRMQLLPQSSSCCLSTVDQSNNAWSLSATSWSLLPFPRYCHPPQRALNLRYMAHGCRNKLGSRNCALLRKMLSRLVRQYNVRERLRAIVTERDAKSKGKA